MNLDIDWMFLAAAAFGVAGVIEYVKGFARKAPKWLWRLALPFVCAGIAVTGGGGITQIAVNAVLILAMSQLCYEAIIGAVKKLVTGFIGRSGGGK